MAKRNADTMLSEFELESEVPPLLPLKGFIWTPGSGTPEGVP
jgi:hypothetical protein